MPELVPNFRQNIRSFKIGKYRFASLYGLDPGYILHSLHSLHNFAA